MANVAAHWGRAIPREPWMAAVVTLLSLGKISRHRPPDRCLADGPVARLHEVESKRVPRLTVGVQEAEHRVDSHRQARQSGLTHP